MQSRHNNDPCIQARSIEIVHDLWGVLQQPLTQLPRNHLKARAAMSNGVCSWWTASKSLAVGSCGSFMARLPQKAVTIQISWHLEKIHIQVQGDDVHSSSTCFIWLTWSRFAKSGMQRHQLGLRNLDSGLRSFEEPTKWQEYGKQVEFSLHYHHLVQNSYNRKDSIQEKQDHPQKNPTMKGWCLVM